MRAWWVALLVAGLAFVPPSVGQAASDGPVRLLEDAAGDAQLTLVGQPTPAPADTGAESDLVFLDVTETATEILVTTGFAGYRQDEYFGAGHFTYFRHQDTLYAALGFTRMGGDRSAYLLKFDEGPNRYTPVAELAQDLDTSAKTVTVHVPRTLLPDGEGAAPFPGRVLDQLYVEAYTFNIGNFGFGAGGVPVSLPGPTMRLGDRMPDSGFAPSGYEVRLGIAQTGHARLFSEQPFRASNGEASSFVFRVNASNEAAKADRFSFRIVDPPMGWDIRLPSTIVEIPAGVTLELPVVVRTEFGHQHGSAAAFLLEMQSLSDPSSVGRVELGLRYADPPQPAGHHNVLTFHTARDEASNPFEAGIRTAIGTLVGRDFGIMAYMNADPDDPNDAQLPVKADTCGFDTQQPQVSEYCWEIPLAPRLELGLDFDLAAGPGSLVLPIRSLGPLPNANVSGRLLYVYPAEQAVGEEQRFRQFERITLAEVVGKTVELGANADVTLDLSVVPTPDSDFVAWRSEAYLVLRIDLVGTRPPTWLGHAAPELLPGGQMTLPLLEYADPIDGILFGAGTARLQVAGPMEKAVNPGETAVFNLTLENSGDLEETFVLAYSGTHVEWAVLDVGRVTIPAKGSTHLLLAVRVPPGAADGEVADLVVEASSTKDVALRTLAHVKATVDTDADHPDEAAALGTKARQAAPGAPLFALLGALGAAALLLRRRGA